MKIILVTFLLILPLTASAAYVFNNIAEFFNFLTNLISSSVLPLIVVLALAYFFYGMGKFIKNADSETEREKGRQVMIWGVVALFVIVSVWGLVGVLANTFGVELGVPRLSPP